MSKDFKSNGVRVSRLITSGGISGGGLAAGNNLALTVYSASQASNTSGGIKDTNMMSGVGTDVALFVSGTESSPNLNPDPALFGEIDLSTDGRVLLGGDLVVSGAIIGGNPWMKGMGPVYTNVGDLAIISEASVNLANSFEFNQKGQAPGPIRQKAARTEGFGSDTFMYITGSIGVRGRTPDSANQEVGIVTMAGDLHVSGNFTVDGSGAGGLWTDGGSFLRPATDTRDVYVGTSANPDHKLIKGGQIALNAHSQASKAFELFDNAGGRTIAAWSSELNTPVGGIGPTAGKVGIGLPSGFLASQLPPTVLLVSGAVKNTGTLWVQHDIGPAVSTDAAIFKVISGSVDAFTVKAAGMESQGGVKVTVNDEPYSDKLLFQVNTKNAVDITAGAEPKKLIYADGDFNASGQKVLILSGGASPLSPNESVYPDLCFFVSGSIGSKGTADKGVSVFGGDVVISGTLHGGSPLKIGQSTHITDVDASTQYVNVGATSGDSGYGFKSDAGTMKWKNNGGTWAIFGGGTTGVGSLDDAYNTPNGGGGPTDGAGAEIEIDGQPLQLKQGYVTFPALAVSGSVTILRNSKDAHDSLPDIEGAQSLFANNALGSGLGVLLVSGSQGLMGTLPTSAKRGGISAFAGDLLISGNIINCIPTSGATPANRALNPANAIADYGVSFGAALYGRVRNYSETSLIVTGALGQKQGATFSVTAQNWTHSGTEPDFIGFGIGTSKFRYSADGPEYFSHEPNLPGNKVTPGAVFQALTMQGCDSNQNGMQYNAPGSPFSFGHVGMYKRQEGDDDTENLALSYTYLPSGSAGSRFRVQSSTKARPYGTPPNGSRLAALDMGSDGTYNRSYIFLNSPNELLDESGVMHDGTSVTDVENDCAFSCVSETSNTHRSTVGIGTATPQPSTFDSSAWDCKLQIANYTKAAQMQLTRADASGFSDDDPIGEIKFTATGSAAHEAFLTHPNLMWPVAQITAAVDGTVAAAGYVPGKLQFVTYDDTGASNIIAEARAATTVGEFATQCLAVGTNGTIADTGTTSALKPFVVKGEYGNGLAPGRAGWFQNTYNSTSNSRGIRIQCGDTTPTLTGDSKWIELVTNDGTARSYIQFDTGTPYAAFAAVSDQRLKKNIEYSDLDTRTIVNSLKWRKFDWKDESFAPHQSIGLVAQEAEAIYPRLVGSGIDDNDYKTVSYSPLLPIAMKELQVLIAENEELKSKNQQLETRLDNLEALLKSKGII